MRSVWLLTVSLFCLATQIADSQLPSNFGPALHRIASAKSWRIHPFHDLYQWLTDPPKNAPRFLSPDGKSELDFLGPLFGTSTFNRIMSLNGYRMNIYPLNGHFEWLGDIAWEWNDHYHGWITYCRTSHAEAIAHFDLAHQDGLSFLAWKDQQTVSFTLNNVLYSLPVR